ncbi:tetratricopeptide repeat protein 41-like isoform X2 [Bolinopsis microptera]|uniref:tetratricopeptide repeat protein 41-like isoform X2 n=1 Tax=Bolinopsis microptera TaxID=2820187 RepID=UPI0030790827
MNSQIKAPCCPFISSTFRDFQEERDYLVKHIFPELQQICKDKCTYFAPIDLRWGINKNQSQEGRVISLCLDYIHDGAPYFICLLGDRYGYHYDEESCDPASKEWFNKNLFVASKEGHPWVTEHKDKSITEMEIIAALKYANCTRAFFYFRDTNYINKKFPDGPTEEQRRIYGTENEKCARKLKHLKDQITASERVANFASPKELGDLILQDMKAAIEEDYRDSDVMVHLPHLPQALTERIHNLKPEKREMILAHHLFEARNGDTSRLANFGSDLIVGLNQHAASIGQPKHKPIMLISGEQGCGKSTLLSRWALQYGNNSDIPLITHYIGCSNYSRDLSHMLENVLQILGVDIDESGGEDQLMTECTRKQWSSLQDNIELFNRVVQAKEQKFVLAIDCLESLSADSDHAHVLEDFTWLPNNIPDTCRIIITCTTNSPQYQNFTENYNSKGENNHVEYHMGGISDVEQRKIVVQKHLETYCKHLDPQQLNTICNTSLSHNPMYLVAVANELRVFGIYEKVDAQIESIVEAPTQETLWYNIFIRWCRDYGWADNVNNNWVQDALCFIAMSRRGLTEQEILGALQMSGYRDTTEVKTADWASFYRAAQDSLIKEHTGIFSLAHGCVQKAVLCSVMGGTPEVKLDEINQKYSNHKLKRMPSFFRKTHNCYHTKLANYFQTQPINWRTLEELPWHWSQALRWKKLHKIVRTPEYFELFRSSSEINQFNTFNIDLFRYWDEMKQHAPNLDGPAETYNRMMQHELTQSLSDVTFMNDQNETAEEDNEEQMKTLVERATNHVAAEESIRLSKWAWLAGQFLGEICDYEPGTKLLQYAKLLCPSKKSDLLYQINYSLGKVYYYKIDWENARRSFLEARKELKKCRKDGNEQLEEECALLNNTVSCMLIMKRLDEAERLLKETGDKYQLLNRYEQSPGYFMYRFNKSRLIAKRATKMTDQKKQEERSTLFREALAIFDETLQFRMKHYGWRHPLVALNWQEQGFLYHSWGDRIEGEKCFKKALEIYEEVLSQDHVLIATCKYHLGMIYQEMRKWHQALQCFQVALKIRQKRFDFSRRHWKDIERRMKRCRDRVRSEMMGDLDRSP